MAVLMSCVAVMLYMYVGADWCLHIVMMSRQNVECVGFSLIYAFPFWLCREELQSPEVVVL